MDRLDRLEQAEAREYDQEECRLSPTLTDGGILSPLPVFGILPDMPEAVIPVTGKLQVRVSLPEAYTLESHILEIVRRDIAEIVRRDIAQRGIIYQAIRQAMTP